MDRSEVIYNANALMCVWLEKLGGIGDVYIEAEGDGGVQRHECTVEDCGMVAGDLLYANNGSFSKLRLCYRNKAGEEFVAGEIDVE